MPTCAIPGCANRSSRKGTGQLNPLECEKKLSFHKLPSDPKIRELWIKAVHDENFKPQNAFICSSHFGNECFKQMKFGSKWTLIPGSIPSKNLENVNVRSRKRKLCLKEKEALVALKKLKFSSGSSSCTESDSVSKPLKQGSNIPAVPERSCSLSSDFLSQSVSELVTMPDNESFDMLATPLSINFCGVSASPNRTVIKPKRRNNNCVYTLIPSKTSCIEENPAAASRIVIKPVKQNDDCVTSSVTPNSSVFCGTPAAPLRIVVKPLRQKNDSITSSVSLNSNNLCSTPAAPSKVVIKPVRQDRCSVNTPLTSKTDIFFNKPSTSRVLIDPKTPNTNFGSKSSNNSSSRYRSHLVIKSIFCIFILSIFFIYNLFFASSSTDTISTPDSTDILDEDALREKFLNEIQMKQEEKRRKKEEEQDTPRKVKLKMKLSEKKKEIKRLQQSNYRKTKKVATMKNVIQELKEKSLLCSDTLDILKQIGGPNKEFLDRQVSAVTNEPMKRKYEQELRAFALTLHYKSPSAYCYVRDTFHSALPHPNTIYKWYSVIDGSPGFTKESFKALKEKYHDTQDSVYGALSLDEMSIRKHIETDGKKYFGYVDMGSGIDMDNAKEAKDAMVIMLVCINGNWKLPLGYFLTAGVTGKEKATLIEQCLRLLDKTKIITVSLTADGLSSNITMFEQLGCNFDDINNLKTWFVNPCNKNQKIFAFLDTSHMEKLVRNTLGDKGIIFDNNGDRIEWSHIKLLHEVQEKEGLTLANKLTSKHINYSRNKMKVCLATQVLSGSVAASLQVLHDLKVDGFSNVRALIRFLLLFNTLFDIFNSKNIAQPGFKKPLCEDNYEKFKEVLTDSENYIKGLACDKQGNKIIDSLRKTGFIGFLIDIRSLFGLYDMLIKPGLLKFIPTHKLCQDHLEMFFCILRMMGGRNNNPTARHIISAFKKCLVHMELKSSISGNCVAIENISILTCSSKVPEKVINVTASDYDFSLEEDDEELQKYLDRFTESDYNVDHCFEMNPSELTDLTEEILKYIAGFVVRRLAGVLKCNECVQALIAKPGESHSRLIAAKNKGGLVEPSYDAVKVVRICEKVIRLAHITSETRAMPPQYTPQRLTNDTLRLIHDRNLYDKLFPGLEEHFVNQEAMLEHKFFLIKSICLRFITLRIHHICKRVVDKSGSNRQLYNKLVLFQGF